MGAAYRCEACAEQPQRCAACRERRKAAELARREAHRAAGLCLMCSRAALPGLTRCEHHRDQNRRLSRAAHQRARDAEDTTTEIIHRKA